MGIKKFQENTVKAVINSFKNHNRVLVADEVGLGKTIIAREVINMLCNEHPEKVYRTIYLCSNQNIIKQNIEKLNIENSVFSERLSMQSINLYNKEIVENNKRQVLPITIGTSIITNGTGTRSERVFMYLVLSELEIFNNYRDELKEIIGNKRDKEILDGNKNRFDIEIEYIKDSVKNLVEIESFKTSFLTMLDEELKTKKLGNILLEKCKEIRQSKNRNTKFEVGKSKILSISNNEVVKKMRRTFVEVTLANLKPDLIIMDEFQNFRKEILQADEESSTGMIVKEFLKNGKNKILLLSATPYKLYNTLAEIEANNNKDEAFNSFFEVVNFLLDDIQEKENFKLLWKKYSNLLISIKENSKSEEELIQAKEKVEKVLNKVMFRTEKTNKMQAPDDSIIKVHTNDVKSYVQIDNALKNLDGFNINMPIEYVKSCPYPLSFIQDYNIKRELERYFKKEEKIDKLKELNKDLLWINREDIERYKEIKNVNSRFVRLKNKIFDKNCDIEKLLWLPPTKPYYETKDEKRTNVYKHANGASKMLIFSNWAIVPRMISTLISYEDERRRIQNLENDSVKYSYSNLDEKFKNKWMTFNVDKTKANSMRLMALMYPSEKLARLYEPREFLNENINSVPDIERIEEEVAKKIKTELKRILKEKGVIIQEAGNEDKKWYYMAPIILDAQLSFDWLNDAKRALKKNKDDDDTNLDIHIERLRNMITEFNDNKLVLGKIPKDLYIVLAKLAIASPSICGFRSVLNAILPQSKEKNDENGNKLGIDAKEADEKQEICEKIKIAKIAGIKFAKLIFNLFNSTEAMTIIYANYTNGDYWRNVLQYSEDGNLQAVLDEYIHLISENITNNEKKAEKIMNIISEAMSIRTTREIVDTFKNFESKVKNENKTEFRMKLHFAVRFLSNKTR